MVRMLTLLIVILLNTLIINYVYTLEKNKCECSQGWKREYIKYFAIITIILVVVNSIFRKIPKSFLMPISTLYSIGGLINIYVLFSYSNSMIKNTCECSNSWERQFIYYYSIFVISLYVFLVAGLIYLSLFNPKKFSKLKNKC